MDKMKGYHFFQMSDPERLSALPEVMLLTSYAVGEFSIARPVSEMKDYPTASLKGFCCKLTVEHTRGILQGAEG